MKYAQIKRKREARTKLWRSHTTVLESFDAHTWSATNVLDKNLLPCVMCQSDICEFLPPMSAVNVIESKIPCALALGNYLKSPTKHWTYGSTLLPWSIQLDTALRLFLKVLNFKVYRASEGRCACWWMIRGKSVQEPWVHCHFIGRISVPSVRQCVSVILKFPNSLGGLSNINRCRAVHLCIIQTTGCIFRKRGQKVNMIKVTTDIF